MRGRGTPSHDQTGRSTTQGMPRRTARILNGLSEDTL